ncbi:MAG: ribosomal-protein-alanine N-acetyltransferase [Sulfurimonas sp. RIFOXYD12_FULL_33_39]|uniref:ribosomal protein S18-alanine N-acetyltransferase n=1 Tax=unclassified Sulfurimonas TaxID=2623549 RepID=UPI0008D8CD84|nr:MULTISPECIES: ribosomal protein S18-alanine N-acetyltransferase [unclassified Sulfurimonas]OHE01824.1 MAG: ribosomal-protein-alanine N-acetyltransferase [Sulfurimonas sp. RIFCSPLOWO2_12_FULL_34_6]OHE09480.1 MAG: ribosomal-protein-alanine N-acetyltransferase [Sulfurimonas sp. RIFOXYD12_FULL_33_39]OHE12739.1 MAG: ribosomal-protein-alanine N-acetyltransferase [Sulfurimonas sp. RIFOXYD2_FULL_34_21]DAB27444.1 MAG TPA: ribosomal-protein-alanine N-acetyltransferase [Sulfurimonas sp. UBA10385]
MTIRKAISSDVSLLYTLEQELFTIDNYPLSRGSFIYHVRNNLIYVAEIEGKVVGYLLVLIKRTKAKLYSIGVKEIYRGRKISQKLLEVTSKELISLGFKQLLLEVRTDNKVAIALYKKAGFKVVKELRAFYKDGCDAYLMELEYK